MKLIRISDDNSLEVDLLDYGARIVAIRLNGTNLALSYPKLDDYLEDTFYLGATVGPICNRISNSTLSINDRSFELPSNEGSNCLHSGGQGFDKEYWSLETQSNNKVQFKLEYDLTKVGLFGTIICYADYRAEGGALNVEYTSSCDQDTYLNLTNHVYFNLAGLQRDITEHEFKLYSSSFVNVDKTNIPTGGLTVLRSPMLYSLNRQAPYPEFAGGCDHHFNVDQPNMLSAYSPASGVGLEVSGNSPGFQFYTGKHLTKPFQASNGFCVEAQYAPDAINQAALFSPILRRGQIQKTKTSYLFSQT